ncbi:MAG: murein L,D-transpeptidase [Thermoleophilia bacterium]|nr:murein L,D-transpeptidase [Thermoleophilia bacterium]
MWRRAAVALAGAVLLGLPATARAELVVSGSSPELGASTSTTISFVGGSPASVVVYVPLGFTASLGQTPGTAVGRASVELAAGVGVDGPLVVDDAANPACGTAGHEAVWRLPGASELLLAVDAVASTDVEAPFAAYRIVPCELVTTLELQLDGVFTNPVGSGRYTWRAVAAPDGGGAVESRSTQLLPVRLTFRGGFDRRDGKAVLTGSLTAGGSALAGARVAIEAGRPGFSLAPAGAARTGLDGRFREERRIAGATVFEASVELPVRVDPDGCQSPIAPAGCAGATLAPVKATSDRITVRVPAPRTLRLGSRGAEVRRLHAELVRLRFLPAGGRAATFGERTWHAVVAFQGWQRLSRTGVVNPKTWRALERARVPAPWARIRRGVLIDTARQVLLLVEGGRTVRAIHVSTGAYGRTPRGRFAVYRKEPRSWSVPFGVWMPYASYFHGGFAMHAYSSVPNYPASHGCVRVPPVEAPGVYRFAAYGTPVWVR